MMENEKARYALVLVKILERNGPADMSEHLMNRIEGLLWPESVPQQPASPMETKAEGCGTNHPVD